MSIPYCRYSYYLAKLSFYQIIFINQNDLVGRNIKKLFFSVKNWKLFTEIENSNENNILGKFLTDVG